MARWRHDAEMLEQARAVESSEHKGHLISLVTTSKLVEEKV